MVFNLMSLSHPYVDPLYPSCQKNCQDGQRQQQPGEVQHNQGEGYQQPLTFWRVRQIGLTL